MKKKASSLCEQRCKNVGRAYSTYHAYELNLVTLGLHPCHPYING